MPVICAAHSTYPYSAAIYDDGPPNIYSSGKFPTNNF